MTTRVEPEDLVSGEFYWLVHKTTGVMNAAKCAADLLFPTFQVDNCLGFLTTSGRQIQEYDVFGPIEGKPSAQVG